MAKRYPMGSCRVSFMVRLLRSYMDNFTKNYLICALWSSTDDSGNPIDHNYDVSDLAPEAVKQAISECKDFRSYAGSLLEGLSDEQAGHDFWLTRNGHGAGFWDRGLGAKGRKLSDAAKTFGSCDLYVGDTGKLYFS
jgi:hypothetical protein